MLSKSVLQIILLKYSFNRIQSVKIKTNLIGADNEYLKYNYKFEFNEDNSGLKQFSYFILYK